MLTVGSICAGIGGWDLGLERAGMATRWQVEIDPWCRRVLSKHFPSATQYEDANALDYTKVSHVEVIAAGYPCQPFSQASHGERKGFDDPRNVWPAVARAIRDIRPRFALLENVRGHLSMGFGRVLSDLAAIGYDAEWHILPAAAFGAPHMRERIWIVGVRRVDSDADGERREEFNASAVASASIFGEGDRASGSGSRDDDGPRPFRRCEQWTTPPPKPAVFRMANGIPAGLDRRRLRALGNALVPQIAEFIGRRVIELDREIRP